MPVLLIDGSLILLNTIKNNLRHIDYKHVVDIATDFTIYATGEGIEGKLKQFNLRETKEAFDQRKRLTQINTPDIVNSVRKPLEKVPRTPANVLITWDGKDAKSSNEYKRKLLEIGGNFWGDKSFEKYIAKRLPELDSTDPNTFIIIESKEYFDPKKPGSKRNKPYPFEANSAEAINFYYENNILQWLVVLNYDFMVDLKGTQSQAEVYRIYLDNEIVRAIEIHAETVDIYMQNVPSAKILVSNDENIDLNLISTSSPMLYQLGEDRDKARFFIIEVFKHNMGLVPAKRVGTLTDTTTRERTCIPIINPAKSYFEKSIKSMSEFDLTNCLHVFPRLVQYADACDGSRQGETIIGCNGGVTPAGSKCPSCGGTGFKIHTSAQDIIQIRMPKRLEEIVSLEHVLVYKSPPIDLLKFQQEFAFDKLREAARASVYNDNTIKKSSSAKTATEIDRNLDDTYDTLQPFGDNYSDFFKWGYTCIAALYDMDEKLVIKHAFPADFKFQSLSSLLDELETANKNGAGAHVKYAINKKILGKMYIDQPKELLKIETQEKYFPFPGKSQDEINFIIVSNITTKYNAVLYANFGFVFNDVEYLSSKRSIDFYEMDETMQRTLITAKVNEIITQMNNEANAENASAFGGSGTSDNPDDVQAEAQAKLKGTVGGVQGILDIQASVSLGTTERSAAIAMLQKIYGFGVEDAEEILGEPKAAPVPSSVKLNVA